MRALRVRFCLSVLTVCAATALSSAYAAPTCQDLIDDFTEAFETAESFISTTTVTTDGGRELAFVRARLSRDASGELQQEILEQRGRRPPEGGGENDDGEFSFDCEGHALTPFQGGRYLLVLQEDNPDIPVSGYRLRFRTDGERYLPTELSSDFSVRIVLVPVRGTFTSEFESWVLPGAE
ncbi:MAG: hypothetical protein U5L04_01375 [Trueperaceae bacterium]|nr:hypothetical protein [Trueperaceae bacterium]